MRAMIEVQDKTNDCEISDTGTLLSKQTASNESM